MRRIHGFTQIELMVTVTLLALLSAAVVPEVNAWMRNLRIRNASETLQAGLQKARNEAVRRNRPVTLSLVSLNDPKVMDNSCRLSPSSASWVVSLNDPAGACGSAPSDTAAPFIIDRQASGEGAAAVTVNALQADGISPASTITFDGFGRIANATAIARIDISHSSGGQDLRPIRILMTPSGSIRSCAPYVTSAGDPRLC